MQNKKLDTLVELLLCLAAQMKKERSICFVLFLAYPKGFEPSTFRVGV